MKPLRAIAAAQTIPVRGDVAANVDQHLRLIDLAAKEHAQLVVFPELSLTGYELDWAGELAFTDNDPRLQPLMDAARASGLILIVGAPITIASRLYIGAFILSADGTIDVYTKHHLGAFPPSANPGGAVPPAEATVFHAGTHNPLVPFGTSHVGALAVCADTARASHVTTAARRGATTFLASMFSIPSDLEQELVRMRTYARQHSMAVALANYGGSSAGLLAGGGSAIWSQTGGLLAQLSVSGAGIAIAVESVGGWRAKTVVLPDC